MLHLLQTLIVLLLACSLLAGYVYFWVSVIVALTRALINPVRGL